MGMPVYAVPPMLRALNAASNKETAVLHWKTKPALVIAMVTVLGLFAGFMGGGGGRCGFYW
jgi:hypothetical protein